MSDAASQAGPRAAGPADGRGDPPADRAAGSPVDRAAFPAADRPDHPAVHPSAAPPDDALLLVLTTLASRDEALVLARRVVGQRLAACAQLQAIESVYHWDGALQCEPEQRLLLKTTRAAWPALQALILAEHPYSLPALLALPVAAASPDFADWVRQGSRPAG